MIICCDFLLKNVQKVLNVMYLFRIFTEKRIKSTKCDFLLQILTKNRIKSTKCDYLWRFFTEKRTKNIKCDVFVPNFY